MKLQLKVTLEVFRSSPAGGEAGVTRRVQTQWLTALRNPVRGNHSQSGENWAQRVRGEPRAAEVGEADQVGWGQSVKTLFVLPGEGGEGFFGKV